jgi:UDP-glucuronate 4-epimerase
MVDKKTIIITGVSGFIGRHLCKRLHNEYNIIGYDKVSPHKDFIKYIDRFILKDITDELLHHQDVYAVIHLAAKAGVRESQTQYEQYVKDNILGTKNVLDACVQWWKPKKILLASSSSVYGDRKTPGRETDIPNPKSLYAASKLAMEDISKVYKNTGMIKDDVCNMRIFTVYGPHQRESLAIHKFIDAALKDEEITVYGTGEQSRDFTFIEDLCFTIELLLRKQHLPDKLNVGFGSTITVNEILDIISSELNKNLKIKYEPMNMFDVMTTKSDTRLFNRVLPGHKPEFSIRQGIIKQIEERKKHL